MANLIDELSAADREYIEAEIAHGRGQSVADVLARALNDYRDARESEELGRLVREGLDSGGPYPVTDEFWERRRMKLGMSRQRQMKY